MKIIDLHCDALFRIWLANGKLDYSSADQLETNKERLKKGGVNVQCFAVYAPPQLPMEQKFQAVMQQVHYFYHEVLGKNPDMKQIREWGDFDRLQTGEIGVMLTMEGVDAIGSDLYKLSILHQLGVRCVGLTWNYANWAADGVLEPRNAGLSIFGQELVRFNNENKLLTDVSHLGERSFWDTLELARYPIASHSNARSVFDHPRNLSDEQAKALFAKGGTVHVFFAPQFVKQEGSVTIDDLLKHIDHFCSIGGVKQLGIGSDFDGISIPGRIEGLGHAGMMDNLINALLQRYKEEEVRGFTAENFLRCRPK
ncbi:membrane dipeptidase [Brevibacillus fluminis]|uniref:Membrane dipeptidase n=1 Tax=Brevibacillus fluminis TaxID=511487 RepID=A0A3M8D228_9BACL|nr:dipeptidase [Brevibacillus fluminis]RNB81245.1 membrane dipeptidase [Brevibacillus fluminis]